jgi:hypothetical protein
VLAGQGNSVTDTESYQDIQKVTLYNQVTKLETLMLQLLSRPYSQGANLAIKEHATVAQSRNIKQ